RLHPCPAEPGPRHGRRHGPRCRQPHGPGACGPVAAFRRRHRPVQDPRRGPGPRAPDPGHRGAQRRAQAGPVRLGRRHAGIEPRRRRMQGMELQAAEAPARAVNRVLLLLALAAAMPASAQDAYPARPIHLITPAAQGGTTDLLARVFGARLSEALKQQVLVENRASNSGVLAGEMTANAPPDGYTLLLAYHQHTVNGALNAKLPYHPVDNFTPITQLTSAGLMLVVHPSSPPKTLAEFLEWTKNFKGALNYGSAGNGSGGHLAGELYKQMTGVKAEHIPYKGAGPAMMDLVAGQYH